MVMRTSVAETDTQTSGWQAELKLGLKKRPDKTVLATRQQRGPLAVQRPFYPEGDPCHLYLLHPPGGVVGGDGLHIETRVESGSGVITTPGATKFYRSAGETALQQQNLYVADNATLEWLPQENIFFPGTRSQLSSEIQLEGGARFIGWEMQCLGRPANQERFNHGTVDLCLCVYRNQKPLLLEKFHINGETDLDIISGLRGQPVMGTLVATHTEKNQLQALHDAFGQIENANLGLTLLDDLLVCRYLGASTEQARNLFIQIWTQIRPQTIQREACPPRIWNT